MCALAVGDIRFRAGRGNRAGIYLLQSMVDGLRDVQETRLRVRLALTQ